MSRAQDLDVRSGRPAQITQLRYQGMILCQRHVCYYSERGDLLMDRFGLMMKNYGIHDQRPSDKARWTSEKQIRCAARYASIARQVYEAGKEVFSF